MSESSASGGVRNLDLLGVYCNDHLAAATGGIELVSRMLGRHRGKVSHVAREMGREKPLGIALRGLVIASIGPTTTEEIRRHGLEPDMVASHPKMGVLITEAAAGARDLMTRKGPDTRA